MKKDPKYGMSCTNPLSDRAVQALREAGIQESD